MQPTPDDQYLMQRIAAQDQQALGLLYDSYGGPVYSLAYRILQNVVLAEEVTQDTFLKVWKQTSHWDPEKGKLLNWLLRIAQFGAIDRLRHERRRPAIHPLPIDQSEEQALIDHSDGALWQDGTVLRHLIGQLPTEQASLIELAFFQGMSHSDIADAVSIPLGTVKSRLRIGLHRLRELWFELENTQSGRG